MNRYTILLRGVNVGGKNLLPMKELKALLENNGFNNVTTYIQSGNLLLTGHEHPEKKICELIQTHFGFTPETLVLTKDEFKLAISNCPFQKGENKFIHFYFCKDSPKADTTKILALASQTERFELLDKIFYLHAPDGIGRSKLVANIESCLGVRATGRNLNTINKLNEMMDK
ncbi:DUF1697 domain-containing protein [Shewanella woodyi]|uniref:DUF1697 domain-containing protein n=1 Tax=Shewanella woodyi (strain ATCC 51908 / MS32) TaxID=392500 RepID=B1KJL4_SHEWM|nr:DUF1697 domain-containing protein [Shewanella woodyi]ACA85687.1 protein of unknown function DUF1697 [Shewanella woodyi ATCC 51908]